MSCETEDPIIRLKQIKDNISKPEFIYEHDKLDKAITIMRINNYSQLPVLSEEEELIGYISWTTIGTAFSQGVQLDIVKHYVNKHVIKVSLDTPLLNAIRSIYEHDFVCVMDTDTSNKISGIITTTDISLQFLEMAQPFFLLEQIEKIIRKLIKIIPLCEIKEILNRNTQLNSINDLTFGNYISLIKEDNIWKKLELKYVDKEIFIREFDEIRNIRNGIMHFKPSGNTHDKCNQLEKIYNYLTSIIFYRSLPSSSDSASGENRGM